MVTLKLTDQQSARIAELPAEYRVVGVDYSAPLVLKPAGQLLRIQPNGRLVNATIAARRRLEDRRAIADGRRERDGERGRSGASRENVRRLREGPSFATPYTAVFDS
jgi:hypothetical protein